MKFTTATLTIAALAASASAFPVAHNGTTIAHNKAANHTVTKTVRLEAGSPKPVTTPSASNDELLKFLIEKLESGNAGPIQKRKLDAIEINAKKLDARQTEDLLGLLGGSTDMTGGGLDSLLGGLDSLLGGLVSLLGGLDGAGGGGADPLGGLEDLTGGASDLGSGATGGLEGLDSSLGGLTGNPGGEGGDLGGLTGGLEGLGGDSTGAPKEDGGNQLVPGQDGKQDNGKGPDLGSITDSLPKLSDKDKGKTGNVNGTLSSLQSHKGKQEDGEGQKGKTKDEKDPKGKTDDGKGCVYFPATMVTGAMDEASSTRTAFSDF
ncbi:unnamed protein product [Clonostachys rhizophaga]|uniref:Uncharacterized protein n=1 Tax=Clonostachys rhizophaga TaxID=160324 RepID=A0A9N9YFE3_9HYPO|nr:unnamed protein product [Clonostachys rhizophaga]